MANNTAQFPFYQQLKGEKENDNNIQDLIFKNQNLALFNNPTEIEARELPLLSNKVKNEKLH